jgi:hypothetical protein
VLLADRYFMQHDEIRTMNWDTGDQLRALEPAAILADNVRRCEEIIQKHHPGADVWVWSDMFDEFHNAVQGPYYLVRGDLRGSADDIPSSVGMVNWNGREGIAQNSLGFFADRGFRQISAPYYDRDEQQIRRWKEWTRDVPDFEGMMYTTWQKKYDHLEAFGDYAWNHAPYVYHTPLWGITPGQKALTWTKVIGDRWDPDWELTDCRMHLRHHPGDPFTEVVIPSVPGELTEHWIDIPATATWMQWYVTATDNRGWTTRIPFVDTLYYEVGDITTALSSLAASPALHCAAYPQPAYAGAELMLEWYVPGNAEATITLSDLLGRRVFERNLGASDARMRTTRLALPQLPRGVYIGVLRSAQGSRSMRIALR